MSAAAPDSHDYSKGIRARVFVLMPFASEYDAIHVAITAAANAAGATARRVDEQIHDSLILERIYSQIRLADLIIADMTGRNPNVFYEVGYAHAIGRPVVLLTQRASDIPFDLSQYPHIVYGGDTAFLQAELQARIEHYLGRSWISPFADDRTALGRLQLLANDSEMSLSGTALKAPARRTGEGEARTDDMLPGLAGKFRIKFDVNNTDAYASYYGGAMLSLGTSSRVVRVVAENWDGRRQCRRVLTGSGYMYWPDWMLRQLDPSEGITYSAECYAAEGAWFDEQEQMTLHVHFKGHPLRFDLEVSVINLPEEDFKAWQYGLRRF
jgi:hypothetical protein